MTLKDLHPHFKHRLEIHLTYLQSLEYTLESVVQRESSPLLGPALIATFINESVERLVEIRYYQSGFLHAAIQHLNPPELEWDDYTSTNSMHVYTEDTTQLKGELVMRLDTCFKAIDAHLKANFHRVLIGVWFRGDEINWSGMK